jgi:hypothetical protein
MIVVSTPQRNRAFVMLVASCIVVAIGYLILAATRAGVGPGTAFSFDQQDVATLDATRQAPHVLFRSTLVGDGFGRLAASALAAPGAERAPGPERCDRLYYANGAGLCLTAYAGTFLGPDLQPTKSFALPGIPSRVRLSPDGRYASTTVFVSGHSYAEGTFSTETELYDVAEARVIATLEDFAVTRDGQPFMPEDRNFWGVTFLRDSQHFYATMASGSETYLVQGDIAARTIRTLRTNVECPSISPDNTRIAYKKLVQQGIVPIWRLHVLDLASGTDTPLAETRSVDDQVEWLDDQTVLYSLPAGGTRTDVWAAAAAGSGAPTLFLPGGESPVVLR